MARGTTRLVEKDPRSIVLDCCWSCISLNLVAATMDDLLHGHHTQIIRSFGQKHAIEAQAPPFLTVLAAFSLDYVVLKPQAFDYTGTHPRSLQLFFPFRSLHPTLVKHNPSFVTRDTNRTETP